MNNRSKELRTIIYIKNKRIKMIRIKNGCARIIFCAPVIIGKCGLTYNKTEGDMKTPAGVFSPRLVLSRHKIKTKLPTVKINKHHYFVDDVNSPFYNKLVDKRTRDNFSSAEHLIDYKKEYEYAIDIGYNKYGKKGKGSAVFLHCIGDKNYTAGCIAAKSETVKYIISKIDKNSLFVISK